MIDTTLLHKFPEFGELENQHSAVTWLITNQSI